jgi:hypothetical protein
MIALPQHIDMKRLSQSEDITSCILTEQQTDWYA